MTKARPEILQDLPRTARGDWRIVFGSLFVCAWSGNQFSPLLIMYREFDNYSEGTVTAFLGVYVVGIVPALVLAGPVSDRFGRRPVMTFGLGCGLLGSVFLAFSGLGYLPILLGRVFSGVSIGTATAVGTTWLKELSKPPFDSRADVSAGARRASIGFTLGSALGALIAGLIAQWGPWPYSLPFLLHLLVAAPFLWLLRGVAESQPASSGSFHSPLRISSIRHKRFTRVVLICCPWLFVACGLSYGYQPVLLAEAAGGLGLAYATLLSVLGLASGAAAQPIAKRLDPASSARGLLVSLSTLLIGLCIMLIAVVFEDLFAGAAASIVLGLGFGVGLTSGLLEVQRISPPHELAKLTGIFYAVAYTGFAMPTIMAVLTPPFTTVELLFVIAGLLILSIVLTVRGSRTYLPRSNDSLR